MDKEAGGNCFVLDGVLEGAVVKLIADKRTRVIGDLAGIAGLEDTLANFL
jgi:hypothetical protein